MIRLLVTLPYDAYLWLPRKLYSKYGNLGLLVSVPLMLIPSIILVTIVYGVLKPLIQAEGASTQVAWVALGLPVIAAVLARHRENAKHGPWQDLPERKEIRNAQISGPGDATADASNVLRIIDETDLDDVSDETLERISGSLSLGVRDLGDQERTLDDVEYGPEEVASLCFDLADRGHAPRFAIARLAFADPDVYEPYWDRLVGDSTEDGPDNMMALCRIARANPERVPELVDVLAPLVEADGVGRRQDVAAAFAELSTVHDAPDQYLRKLANDQHPDVRKVAVQAKEFYEEHPYGRYSRSGESRTGGLGGPQHGGVITSSTQEATDESDADGGSGGLIGHSIYKCGGCGSKLLDDMDILAGGTYTCSTCGHELDDQDGAREIYLHG